jgi:hypothetical protein
MGGKSVSPSRMVSSEKWLVIKRLKRGDTQLSQGVSKAEEGQWQKFGPGKMCFLSQFG